VRLHAEKDNVYGTYFIEGTGDFGAGNEISFAAFYLHAIFLHGAKVRATREEGDIKSGLRHARADISSNCPGPGDKESHSSPPASAEATARRRILPVAVVGMLSTR